MPKRSLEPPVLFVFLRAVNLGKHNQVPMDRLIAAMDHEGYPPSSYLLASGNLALTATEDQAPTLKATLPPLIAAEFGVNTAVVSRTPEQLAELLETNPFGHMGRVYVSLWDGEADPGGITALNAVDFSPDALHLVDGAAFTGFAAASHDSALGNARIEKQLKVVATARNVNTFTRLLKRFAPEALPPA